jgi:hypothetical protein
MSTIESNSCKHIFWQQFYSREENKETAQSEKIPTENCKEKNHNLNGKRK